MENYGFFNAQLVDGVYDRVYLADTFAKYFAAFISNGVYGGKGDELIVLAENVPGMAVQVQTGQGYINGYWYENVSPFIVTLDIADGIDPRIDSVVLRWYNTERKIGIAVKKGEYSMTPQVPALIRNMDYFELQLCTIFVGAGVVEINQSNITDTRPINAVCGFVHGLIQQFDTTAFGIQLQSFIDDFIAQSNIDYQGFVDWLQSQRTNAEQEINDLLAALNEIVDENIVIQLEQRLGSLELWSQLTDTSLNALANRVTVLEQATTDTAAIKAIVLAAFHPVGSIYMSVSSVNPGTTMGGTWISWGSGHVPVGVNSTDTDFNVVEKTGGAKTHVNPQTIHNHVQTQHYHPQTDHIHTQTQHYHGMYHIHPLGAGYAKINFQPPGPYFSLFGAGYEANRRIAYPTQASLQAIGNTGMGDAVGLGGTTDGASTTNTEYSSAMATGGTGAMNTGYSDPAGTGNSATMNTGAGSSLQPYITCYMWKRTA